MCGRYQLNKIPREIRDWFPVTWRWKFPGELAPRYNVAPSSEALVVRADEAGPVGEMLVWGYRPHWMKQKSKAQINARAETLFETPMFRHSAQARRCLVIADGFYEPKGKTQPRPWYRFHYEDDRLFAFAGVWTRWRNEDEDYDNFAIVTSTPNTAVAPIHDRMPVIVEPDGYAAWLDAGTPREAAAALCAPAERAGLTGYRVSDYAKNPRNEGPACIAPVDALG
jgi:putative SOS response-associated peptidase YedK